MRQLAILALAGCLVTGLAACTVRDERVLHRAWQDAGGKYFDRVNLNTATRGELAHVPGLSDSDADHIIANRPYGRVFGLVRKGVISEERLNRIRDYLYVD